MKKNKKFEKHSCAFKNEAECEEEMNEDGYNLNEVDEEYFESDD